MTLIECIPNFSTTNESTLEALINTIKKFSNLKFLDLHRDTDHNRSVITFIGNKDVFLAAFEIIKTASELIDMSKHKGEHPRIGATDVFPFVPLKNIEEKEIIEETRKLAKKIAKELNIPIYLYEKSALKKERENLANIRNREYLKEPDFGPIENKRTGKTVIGLRDFLIAYNINLKSSEIKIAKEISKEIRESNGGLKNVKAIGIKLDSRKTAQVSMNLTNFRVSNMSDVYKAVEKLCKKYNTEILESELIGLTPKKALGKMTAEELKIFNWHENKILEKYY